jgi:hypothetical protein
MLPSSSTKSPPEISADHDADFGDFCDRHQFGTLVFVGNRSGQGGKQDKGNNQQRRADGDQHFGGHGKRNAAHGSIGDHDGKAAAQQVIVECA